MQSMQTTLRDVKREMLSMAKIILSWYYAAYVYKIHQ